jgi:conjugal transfer pilus assembly protein TraB
MTFDKLKLTPLQQKIGVYAALGVTAAVAGLLFIGAADKKPLPAPKETTSLTGGAKTRDVSIDALATRLTDLERDLAQGSGSVKDSMDSIAASIAALATRMESIEQTSAVAAPAPAEKSEMDIRLASLEETLRDLQDKYQDRAVSPSPSQVPSAPSVNPVDRPAVSGTGQGGATTQAPAPQTVAAPKPPSADLLYQPAPVPPSAIQAPNQQPNRKSAPKISRYDSPEREVVRPHVPPLRIAAGSIITTYLLTGMDAPTGTKASEEPVPILMRIKREALEPNFQRADIVECHLLGGGYGELASQRVLIRGELASCILSDGSVYEGKTQFFVTGEDGKVGIRGNLVSRNGAMIANAAKAGFAESLTEIMASAVQPDEVTIDTVMGSAAAGASGQAFDMLAEYYIGLAEETFPVIEIPNSRFVDVVLTKGLEITFEDEDTPRVAAAQGGANE